MTNGVSSAAKAGATPTCCRISEKPKTTIRTKTTIHGKGGPARRLAARERRCRSATRISQAAAALGVPAQSRHGRRRSRTASAIYQLTQRHARRSSAAMAYLAPNRGRKNLIVRKQGARRVRRMIIEKGVRATAVELIERRTADRGRQRGDPLLRRRSARRGLLQLSGVGPGRSLCASLGVAGRASISRRVGANLQDHLDLYCICEVSAARTPMTATPEHTLVGGGRPCSIC